MRISDLYESIEQVSPSDRADALRVLKDWSFEYRVDWGWTDIDKVFANALSKAIIRDIPCHELKVHHDWGRRPKSDAPIIVAQLKDHRYIMLDGQHRLMVAREAGQPTIKAIVLQVPIRYSKPSRKFLYDKD